LELSAWCRLAGGFGFGFWYLEAEDLRRHQAKGVAIDLDEALALLEDISICLDSPGLGCAQFERSIASGPKIHTLQWATAVAGISVSERRNAKWTGHTRLLLAEALHTRSGGHGERAVVEGECRCRRETRKSRQAEWDCSLSPP
jgi:hypothetical protein